MSTPVAMIPYSNMAPYRELGAPEGCHFTPLVPKKSIAALRDGTVAAAAVPVGGLAPLKGVVETVGRYGIAARGACMSVLLFSKLPFAQMTAPNRIHLTGESASSVRLLYLLMGQTMGFDKLPLLTASPDQADGQLLIGDRALIQGVGQKMADRWPHVADLAQLWFENQRLPFVFARWVVRKEAPPTVKQVLADWLDRFRNEEAALVQRAVAPSAGTLGLSEDVVVRYFTAIRRCLDESDLAGQALFCRQIDEHRREPLFAAA